MVTDVVTLASSLFGDQRMETVFPIQHPPGLVNKCDSSGLNHKPLPGPVHVARGKGPWLA